MSTTATETQKRCPGCGAARPVSDFAKNDALATGHDLVCKGCKKNLEANSGPSAALSGYYRERERVPALYSVPRARIEALARFEAERDGHRYSEDDPIFRSEKVAVTASRLDQLQAFELEQEQRSVAAGSERHYRENESGPSAGVARYVEELEQNARAKLSAERHREELREYASAERSWGLFATSVGVHPLAVPAPPPPPAREEHRYTTAERSALEEVARKKGEEATEELARQWDQRARWGA